MANDKHNDEWINFKADDLPQAQHDLFTALLKAKVAFEASFPAPDGKALRFSYKGADFDRLGFCIVNKPQARTTVATNLSAWIAAQKAAGARV